MFEGLIRLGIDIILEGRESDCCVRFVYLCDHYPKGGGSQPKGSQFHSLIANLCSRVCRYRDAIHEIYGLECSLDGFTEVLACSFYAASLYDLIRYVYGVIVAYGSTHHVSVCFVYPEPNQTRTFTNPLIVQFNGLRIMA